MKTFERYFFTELLLKISATVLVLGIVVVGQSSSKLFTKIVAGNYPADAIGRLLLFSAFDALIFLLPFAAMLAVTLTMGRYYRDSEAYAAFSCGIGYTAFCRILMQCALPLTLLLFVLVMKVAPAGERQYQVTEQLARQHSDVAMVPTGGFFSPGKGTVLFVEDYDPESGELHAVFAARFPGGEKMIETARLGSQVQEQDGLKLLYLHDGYLYEGKARQGDYRVSRYRERRISLSPGLPPKLGDDPEEKGLSALLASPRLEDRAELQRRLVMVVSLPILMLLVFALNLELPRQGRNSSIAISILAFLFYAYGIVVTAGRVAKGDMAVLPGAWWIPAAALVATVAILTRRRIKRRIRALGSSQ